MPDPTSPSSAPARRGVKLTEEVRALLQELARYDGVLTCRLAEKVFGPAAPTYKATNRLRTLGKIGLARRATHNNERWHITPAGREALSREKAE